jgi:hypothetical protein
MAKERGRGKLPKFIRLLDLLEWITVYELLFTIPSFRSERFAFWYVVTTTAILGALVATSHAWLGWVGTSWMWLPVSLAAYRLFDIARWWADLLLDRRHYNLVSAERTLQFAIANLAETALIAAIWLMAAGAEKDAGEAAFEGFSLVSQLSRPEVSTGWARIAVVLVEMTALLLLLGGVASLVAIVQEKLEVTGEHKAYSKWARLFRGRRRRKGGHEPKSRD